MTSQCATRWTRLPEFNDIIRFPISNFDAPTSLPSPPAASPTVSPRISAIVFDSPAQHLFDHPSSMTDFWPFLSTKSVIAQTPVGESQTIFRKSLLTPTNLHCVTLHFRLQALLPLKSHFSIFFCGFTAN